jgi:hypothetical protein
VLARGGCPPVERPEPPGVALRPCRGRQGVIEPRRHPGPIIDLDLHCRDRRAPGGAPEVYRSPRRVTLAGADLSRSWLTVVNVQMGSQT